MISAPLNHHPVIIVGAGPVGLTTAANLAKAGVPVLVLERSHQIDQSPRAASYQPCTQAEILEAGVWDEVQAAAVVNDVQTFWMKGKKVAHVEKKEGGTIFPAGVNLPQPELAKILCDHLINACNGRVLFKQEVVSIKDDPDNDAVQVVALDRATEQKTVYHCNWLVGADGAGSSVRKLSNITFEGFSWPKEDFVATNVRFDFAKHGFTTGNMVIDPVHWSVVAILDKTGLWRCAFGIRPGLTNEEIRAELDDHFKHIFPVWPAEYELVQLNKYKPHQRCASTFRKGRVLLAGDAAHSNNPIGGLGLTTGLLDAGPLGRALAAVINGTAPTTLLDKWATLRREKWLTFTNGFSIENKRIIQRGGYSDDPLGIWKNDNVAKAHDMQHWIKTATREKEQEDEEWLASLVDPQKQLLSRVKQWHITMDPRWMEDYEAPEAVKRRLALRPDFVDSNVPC